MGYPAGHAGSDIQVASWLDGGSSSKIAGVTLNTAVVGEPLEVLVSVSNPLALELSVSRMRLVYEAEPDSASAVAPAEDPEAAEAVSGPFAEVGAVCLILPAAASCSMGFRASHLCVQTHAALKQDAWMVAGCEG